MSIDDCSALSNQETPVSEELPVSLGFCGGSRSDYERGVISEKDDYWIRYILCDSTSSVLEDKGPNPYVTSTHEDWGGSRIRSTYGVHATSLSKVLDRVIAL